jgi:hypothetical protein
MLEDEDYKELLCKLVACRILCFDKIKLPLYYQKRWKRYYEISDYLVENVEIPSSFGEQMRIYYIGKLGFNLKILDSQLGIFLDYVLERYKYKNLVKAEEGDCVIDGGGCHGETALYFSELIGKDGKVFSFEFNEDNILLFRKNLDLNPKNKEIISLIERPLGLNSQDFVGIYKSGSGSHIVELTDEK